MNMKSAKRGVARVLAAAAIAGALVGLAGCQTGNADTTIAPTPSPVHAPGAGLPRGFEGQSADRMEREVQRQIARGVRPSSTCADHTVVEHPDGGFHLVCAQPID
jgi:hypothetical protein